MKKKEMVKRIHKIAEMIRLRKEGEWRAYNALIDLIIELEE